MSNEKLIAAGGGVVIGVFVGLGIGGALVGDKITAAVGSALEPVQAMAEDSSTADAVSALSERISALEAQMAESASSTSDISEAARAQIESIQTALADRIDGVIAATSTQAEDLRSAIGDLLASAPAPVAAEEEAPVAAAMPDDLPAGDAVAVGETAVFADGAVRAFVSRVDEAGGSARLSVNGEMASISVGQAVPVSIDAGDCSVAVTGVSGDGAILSSDCGMASAAAAPEEGFRPGETAIFADGALRVFVASLAADGSAARIAINGVDTQIVEAGASVSANECTVTVTGVGGGLVALDGTCG